MQGEFLTPDDSDEHKSPTLIAASEMQTDRQTEREELWTIEQLSEIPLNMMITRERTSERRSCGKASD